MTIRGISVEIESTAKSKDSTSNKRVCLPADLMKWADGVRRAVDEYGHICVSIADTESPDSIAIAIGHPDSVQSASEALDREEVFGFVIELSVLRQLRGAIDAAIVCLER